MELGEEQKLASLLGIVLPLERGNFQEKIPQTIESKQLENCKQDTKHSEHIDEDGKEEIWCFANIDKNIVIKDLDSMKNEMKEAFTKSPKNILGFKCKICKQRFLSRKLVKEHKQIDHQESINIKLECTLYNICSKTFSSKYILISHIKQNHESEADAETFEPAFCNICSKTYTTKYILKTHMKTHVPNFKIYRPMCSECSRTFSSQSILKKHIMSEHGENKYTTCSMCGKNYTLFSIKKSKLSENKKEDRKKRSKLDAMNVGKF